MPRSPPTYGSDTLSSRLGFFIYYEVKLFTLFLVLALFLEYGAYKNPRPRATWDSGSHGLDL